MAPQGKFKLNRRTVGQIMKKDPGLAGALDDLGAEMAAESGPGATVETYTTDRHVAGIVVGAADQARNGTATRAAQAVASRSSRASTNSVSARPFLSRAQWRRAYAIDESEADRRARVSPRYHQLPERRPRRGGGRG